MDRDNKNTEVRNEDIPELNRIEFSTERLFPKGYKVRVLGKDFKVKPLCRWTHNRILDLCSFDTEEDKETKALVPKVTPQNKDNDCKAAAYILLHNPLKIMLFGRIKTWKMKRKYNSETFYAIIETAFNNREEVFFYKSASLIALTQRNRMMKI